MTFGRLPSRPPPMGRRRTGPRSSTGRGRVSASPLGRRPLSLVFRHPGSGRPSPALRAADGRPVRLSLRISLRLQLAERLRSSVQQCATLPMPAMAPRILARVALPPVPTAGPTTSSSSDRPADRSAGGPGPGGPGLRAATASAHRHTSFVWGRDRLTVRVVPGGGGRTTVVSSRGAGSGRHGDPAGWPVLSTPDQRPARALVGRRPPTTWDGHAARTPSIASGRFGSARRRPSSGWISIDQVGAGGHRVRQPVGPQVVPRPAGTGAALIRRAGPGALLRETVPAAPGILVHHPRAPGPGAASAARARGRTGHRSSAPEERRSAGSLSGAGWLLPRRPVGLAAVATGRSEASRGTTSAGRPPQMQLSGTIDPRHAAGVHPTGSVSPPATAQREAFAVPGRRVARVHRMSPDAPVRGPARTAEPASAPPARADHGLDLSRLEIDRLDRDLWKRFEKRIRVEQERRGRR